MMKYTVKFTAQLKKDYKLAKKHGKNIKLLAETINLLAKGIGSVMFCPIGY